MSSGARLRKSASNGVGAASDQTVGAGSRSNSNKKKQQPQMDALRTNRDEDDDDVTEETELTALASTPASSGSTTVLQLPMGEGVELAHPYQDQQAHAKQHGKSLPMSDKPEERTLTVQEEMPNMVLLVLLYTLQGVPLGLCLGSIPFLLQKSVSYTQLGIFSFASWPYSLKLLWSPIVDCWFYNPLGRRKSWIIPTQLAIGAMLIYFSSSMEAWIASGSIQQMTVACFILIMFTATQDIAVDGWAVSLLSKANVGYASTCQSIGQNIGFFASYTIFLALSHAEFCNKFRSEPLDVGFVTLGGFLAFWGVAFIICTLYLSFFKYEGPYVPEADEDMGLLSLYSKMRRILQLKPVKQLLLILLTARFAFAAGDNITVLKLIEKGFPKENMAFLVVIMFPFDLICPVLVGRWSKGSGNAFIPWYYGYPFRVGATLLGVALVYTFPELSSPTAGAEELSYFFYARVVVIQLIYSLASNVLFVSQCAFFSQVCDESIGGTYMTLLNTISNLGNSWPKFFILASVDWFSCKPPKVTTGCDLGFPEGTDGYYVSSFICFVAGLTWYFTFRNRLLKLGTTSKQYWSCS